MRFIQFLAEQEKKKKFEPPKPLTPAQEKAKHEKKLKGVQNLNSNLRRLKLRVSRDMTSSDERTQMVALVVSLMLKTSERVGNDASAKEGHFGISGLKKKHLSFSDGAVTLKYTGKSGVEHAKTVNDARIAHALKTITKDKKPGDDIFRTSNGLNISGEKINRYLSEFDITAKDIRGFGANDMMIRALNSHTIPKGETAEESEKLRKKKFLEVLKKISEKIGHGANMLRKQYLMPGIEENYIKSGRIPKISNLT
jgi:DNA topoisomerase-1